MKKYIFSLSFLLACALITPLSAREGTEWVTSYSYNANSQALPRVLLVGDSIVKGYESAVRDELAGTAYVSFYATSKSVTDPFYLKELSLILEQYDYKVIQFNNGLHSMGDDRAAWETGLRAALDLLRDKAKGAKIIWATSTPLKDPALTKKAQELNEIAGRVMKENNIPTNDLYALMDPMDRATYWVDTYHYNATGRQMQAKQVVATVRDLLGGKTASSAEAAAALKSAASDTGPDGKITTTSAAPATSMESPIINPRFDRAGRPWRIYPTDGKKGFCTLTDEGPSGGPSAKITLLEKGVEIFQDTAFEAGGTYLVKFWARAEGRVTLSVYIRTVKPPYQFYGQKAPITIGTEWKEYETMMTLPSDYISNACRIFFDFQSIGICWLSDISAEKK